MSPPVLLVLLAACSVVTPPGGASGTSTAPGTTPTTAPPTTAPTSPTGSPTTPIGGGPRDLTQAEGRWVAHDIDAGEGAIFVGDLDGDGTDDLVTDHDDGLRVLHGPPAAEIDLSTEPFVALGHYGPPRASAAGDADGDGLGDVWVDGRDTVYLLAGPLDAGSDLSTSLATVDLSAGLVDDRVLAGGRDLNGDGVGDLLVTEVCNYGTDGRVELQAGPFAGPRVPGDAVATFTVTAGDQLFGCFGSPVGDMDGDGIAELAIGVGFDDYSSTDAEGDVGLWSGDATGELNAPDADVILRASATAVVGFDGDGDGIGDLVLQDVGGFAWLLRGPVVDGAWLPDTAAATILGMVGASPVADVDGDGGEDLLITSAADGRIWLVNGASSGTVGPAEPDWSAVAPLEAWLGPPSAGDMDGDGWPDLAVSARGCCVTGEEGRVWVATGVGL